MRLFFILCSIWLLPMVASSQSCGLFDTIPIPANAQGDITINITDYFNNDLTDPMQGLCGIELSFLHSFSENLEISLTSPSGQTIDVIGANTNDPLAFTFFAKWNISFLPCGETASPDPGYLAQWNNNQPNNFVSGGQYGGSYHPFNGCLEDFNTGPVNGDWVLQFNNNPSTYIGAFHYVRLLFCDNRGVDCCFADPGQLTDIDINSCEGDSLLVFDPTVFHSSDGPNADEYDYIFGIAQDSFFLAFDSTINLIDYPSGVYQICGLSYKLDDALLLPVLDGTLRIDTLYNRLNSFTSPFCGQLSDSCILITINPPITPTNISHDMCQGDTYLIGDSTLTSAGIHPVHLLSEIGCDSLVNVTINLFDHPSIQLDSIICRGDTVQIGSKKYFNSGLFTDTLATAYLSCDSIIELTLTVIEPIIYSIDTTICTGDSFSVGDSIFFESGNYEVHLLSQQECDSTVSLNLNVLVPEAVIVSNDTLTCTKTAIPLNGLSSSPSELLFAWSNESNDLIGTEDLVMVESLGTYYLKVEAIDDGVICSNIDTVFVRQNISPPIADAGFPDTLTCNNSSINIGGVSSTMGDTITYEWQALSGSLLPPTNTTFSITNEPGAYQLIVTNTINGCADSSIVQIAIDSITPTIVLEENLSLNCKILIDTIFSTGSSLGENFNYQWSSDNCIIAISDQPFLEVSCPDKYFLTIENTSTGCVQIDSILVIIDTNPPIAMISPYDSLTCITQTLQLSGLPSTPLDITYSWEGLGILGDPTQANINIDTPGAYQLIIVDNNNFCRDTISTIVIEDTIRPTADAGENQTINCNQPIVIVGSNTTSNGPEYEYHWFTFDSEITTPFDEITLSTATSGTFILEVINTITGCRDTSDVQVFQDNELPFVNAGNPQDFNCGDDFLTLIGNIDEDPISNLSIYWSGPCLIGPNNELEINIECAGIYYLEIIDEDSGCSNIDSVSIGVNPAALFAVLPDTTYMSCETGDAIIPGGNSSLGILTWTHNGEATSLTGLMPLVEEEGLYELTVGNLTGTCVDSDQTQVIFDCSLEAVLVANPDPINCEGAIVSIATTTIPSGSAYQYEWQAINNDCILDGHESPIINVICEGDYTLIVTNTNTQITDTLTVTVFKDDITPIAEAGLSDTLTCLKFTAELDGSLSTQGDSILYFWTDAIGDTIGTEPILPDLIGAGSYLLEVLDTTNHCKSYDQAQVFAFNNEFSLAFGSPIIPCLQDSFKLEIFPSLPSEFYTYEWQGPSFFSPSDSSSIFIDSVGLYTVTATNTLSGCSNAAGILISRENCGACFSLPPPDTITCIIHTVQLEIEYCEPCIDCLVSWSTIDGNIVSGATSPNPVVDKAGVYKVIITDASGFNSTNLVEVIALDAPPSINLGNDGQVINCINDTLEIGVPSFPNHTYTWAVNNGGPFASPTDSSLVLVDTHGDYFLEIRNQLTGCFASDTISIGLDTIAPISIAGNDQYKTCDIDIIILDGSASSQSVTTSYLWAAELGSACLIGETTVNPIAQCPGRYTLTVFDSSNGCQDTSSLKINLSEEIPQITPIGDFILTCNQPDSVVLGSSPNDVDFIYTWCELDSNFPIEASCQNTLDYQIDHPGVYQFELIDTTNNCANSIQITVTQDTLYPLITITENDTIRCNEVAIELFAAVIPSELDIQVNWTNHFGFIIENPTSLSPTVSTPSTYYLSVENMANGCIAMDSTLIINDEATPIVDAGLDTLLNCYHPEISLNGTVQIESSNFSVQWTNLDGPSISNPTVLSPIITDTGFYTLEVINLDNNCSSIDTLFVGEHIDTPSADIFGLDTIGLSCTQEQVILDGSISTSSSANLSYQWNTTNGGFYIGSSTDPSIIATTAGTYQLEVTDPLNGCVDTIQLTLEKDEVYPIISFLMPSQITCTNDMVIIDASNSSNTTNFTSVWSNEANEILLSNNLMLSVNSIGNYQIAITDTNNGCKTTEIIYVGENKVPPNAFIATSSAIDCQQTEVLLDGSQSSPENQINFQWSTVNGIIISEGISSTAIAGSIGEYNLIITDQLNGCKDTTSTIITENATPISGMDYNILTPACSNLSSLGSIALFEVVGGTAPFTITIDNVMVQENTNLNNLTIGNHILRIEDSNSCTWEKEFTIDPPSELLLDLGLDTTILLGNNYTLTAEINQGNIDTIIWSPSDLFPNQNGQLEQIVTPLTTTTYHVWVIDTMGCIAQDAITINLVKPRKYYIPNAFSPNGDGNNDLAQVFGGEEVEVISFFQIFDRWGNLVFEAKEFLPNNPQYGWDGKLDGKDMNAAVFVFQMKIKFIDGWEEFKTGEIILLR